MTWWRPCMLVGVRVRPWLHILSRSHPKLDSSSYFRKWTLGEQTSPRNPTRLNWSLPDLSVMILGGEGGVVLLFCLGSGGDDGAFGGGFGGSCWWLTGWWWLTGALVSGWRREGPCGGAAGMRLYCTGYIFIVSWSWPNAVWRNSGGGLRWLVKVKTCGNRVVRPRACSTQSHVVVLHEATWTSHDFLDTWRHTWCHNTQKCWPTSIHASICYK